MVTKPQKSAEERASAAQLADTVKESAQQIWLAGLGALSKAQQEGGKVFEALVKEGMGLQRRTQAAAEEKLGEASGRMAAMAGELSSKASGQWDQLQGIFEERVSRALQKLGVPSAQQIEELTARLEELQRAVDRLNGGASTTRRTVRKAARPAARPAAKAATGTARKRPARKSAE